MKRVNWIKAIIQKKDQIKAWGLICSQVNYSPKGSGKQMTILIILQQLQLQPWLPLQWWVSLSLGYKLFTTKARLNYQRGVESDCESSWWPYPWIREIQTDNPTGAMPLPQLPLLIHLHFHPVILHTEAQLCEHAGLHSQAGPTYGNI